MNSTFRCAGFEAASAAFGASLMCTMADSSTGGGAASLCSTLELGAPRPPPVPLAAAIDSELGTNDSQSGLQTNPKYKCKQHRHAFPVMNVSIYYTKTIALREESTRFTACHPPLLSEQPAAHPSEDGQLVHSSSCGPGLQFQWHTPTFGQVKCGLLVLAHAPELSWAVFTDIRPKHSEGLLQEAGLCCE